MSKNVHHLRPLNVAISNAYSLAAALGEALDEKKELLLKEAERFVASQGPQPGNTRLIVHPNIECDTPIEFALLGEFTDFNGPGRHATYVALRDIGGGELDGEILESWITTDACKFVMELGSRGDRLAAESKELQQLIENLEKLKDSVQGWESRIQNRVDGSNPNENY